MRRRDRVTTVRRFPARSRLSRFRPIFLLGFFLVAFVSCEPSVVFFTDPYFHAMHGPDPERGVFPPSFAPFSRPFLSRVIESPDDVFRSVSEYLNETKIPKIVLSPLYAYAGERIAAAYPDRTVFLLSRADLSGGVVPALFDRSRAVEDAGRFVANFVRDGKTPAVALFLAETERDLHELESFRRGATGLDDESLIVVREARMPGRDRARQLAREAIAEDPGVVAVFLGHAGVYALEVLAESGNRVVTENADPFHFPNIIATVETAYPKLFDAIRGASGRSAVVVEADLIIHD